MKCHECGQHQADSNTTCAGCGVAFSVHGAAPPKMVIYDEEPAGMSMNVKIGAGLAVVLCLAGIPFFLGGKSAPPAEKVAMEKETSERSPLERNSSMGEVCMQNLMQMGADEDTARSNCLGDKKAEKRIDKRNEQAVKVRNTVPVSKISRVELLIADGDTTPATDNTQPFTLRLRLWDQDGNPASADGEVKFSFSPEGSVWGGFHSTRVYGGNALVANVAGEDVPVPYFEFGGYQLVKDRLEGASEVEITVSFAGSHEATARYSVSYSD